MRLHLLGVNGPFPASAGATSGYLVEAGDALFQLDFGSGVLGRLTALCPPEDLSALLISHWHFDHTADLLPLIYRLQALGKTLPLYAPADGASTLRKIAAESGCFDLTTVRPGDVYTLGDVTLRVGEARHPVPGVGYVLTHDDKSLGYTGDTNTLPSLAAFYRDVDLLLADGLFPTDAWAENKPHLSAALAAALAREAGAKNLVLTHLNPFIPPETLLREARDVYPGVLLAEAGAVYTL